MASSWHCKTDVKWYFIIINVLLIVFFLPLKTSAENSITVVCPQWPGYTNEDGTGLYWEIVKAVYEPLGFEVETKITPWKRAESMIELKRADALVGDYYYSEKDGKQRLYPQWHLSVEDPIIAIFKNDKHKVDDINSLNNKSLVWMRGYDFGSVFLKNIHHQRHEVDSESKGLNLIKFDRYDVFLDYRSNIELVAKNEGIDLSLFDTTIVLLGNKLYLNFSNTDKSRELIELYDRRIPELLENGELERIFQKNNSSLKKFGPDRYGMQ